MRIEQSKQQKLKLVFHAVQAFLIFITACLSLAVLTKNGGTSSTTGYMFGLCFLSVIPLVYLVVVPTWTRAWRLANVYAYAIFDVVFAVLWFAAFVAVAAWTNYGKTHSSSSGTSQDTSESGKGCGSFAFGSKSKCETSLASVAFAVLVFVLWCGTSYLSLKAVFEYRRTGILPNGSSKIHGKVEQVRREHQDKDTWDTNIEEPHDSNHHHGENPFNDPTANGTSCCSQVSPSAQQLEHAEQGKHLLRDPHNHEYASTTHDNATAGAPLELPSPHPGRPFSYNSDTGGLNINPPPAYDPTAAPSALSPDGYPETPSGYFSNPEGSHGFAFR